MAVYTTIDNPELYFQVKTYTGNYTDAHAITLDGSEDMQPDMVWIKDRDDTSWHQITDAVRGATKTLYPNETNAETTDTNYVQSFDSDGFTVGVNNANNQSGADIVAWCWKESATAGFDILTFEGNSTDDTDISHNLSAVPHFMIVRNFDAAKDWCVYHHKNTSAPETDLLVLNTTAATTDTDDRWSDEAPTSSVFTVGDSSQLNASSNTSIAYLWSEKQGFSKFGSYVGTNSGANGPFIYTGFRPAFILIKNITSAADWHIRDNKRSTYNPSINFLMPDASDAEVTAGEAIDILSNGFKIKANGLKVQDSGHTYIYMAFAEAPFVNSNGVPCNAR